MSKQNDQLLKQLYQYIYSNLARTQAAAAQESPYITRVGSDATNFLKQIDSKDYSQGFKPGTFWHLDPKADRTKQRDEIMNAGATGDAALAGGANTGFLALDKQNRQAEFDNNYSREFQDTVQQETGLAKDAQYQVGQLDQNRRMGAASDITGLMGTAFQAENAKPAPLWQSLVLGGVQALPGIIQGIGNIRDGGGGNGGRPAGQSAGAGAFGTYTGMGGQQYGQPAFSQISTYGNPRPFYQGGGYNPRF